MTLAVTLALYVTAALAQITGCLAFWAWLRQGQSALWLAPGLLALALFAWILTLIEGDIAARAHVAYGGILILSSLVWLVWIEGTMPTGRDLLGGALCLAGAVVILTGSQPA